MEKKTIIESKANIEGFHFYIETVVDGPFVDKYSNPPREYYVEHEESKKRVALAEALKIGMIGVIDIPNAMYEFIHEYDKNLD